MKAIPASRAYFSLQLAIKCNKLAHTISCAWFTQHEQGGFPVERGGKVPSASGAATTASSSRMRPSKRRSAKWSLCGRRENHRRSRTGKGPQDFARGRGKRPEGRRGRLAGTLRSFATAASTGPITRSSRWMDLQEPRKSLKKSNMPGSSCPATMIGCTGSLGLLGTIAAGQTSIEITLRE